MRPIEFTCSIRLDQSPAQIQQAITDVARWPEFTGYGPIPGIVRAELETRTDNLVGSRVRVQNTDGSRHTEEIVTWVPGERVTLRMHEFSAPLHLLADHFLEEWHFQSVGGRTDLVRKFSLYPRRWFGAVVLRLVAPLLRRAVMRHLRQMQQATQAS